MVAACMPTANGSTIAPSAKLTVSGSLKDGVCWCCEKPADAAEVLLQKLSTHNWALSHEYRDRDDIWTAERVRKLLELVEGFEALAAELDRAEAAIVK